MGDIIFNQQRKSYIEIGKIYFWTATINKWQNILLDNRFKDVIVQSLSYLSAQNKIDVFAFVIMPNHIHLIFRTNQFNGKETAQGSFLKYTSHEFKRILIKDSPNLLINYKVEASNKNYEFWKRDSLAFELYSRDVAFQKLNYIHNNPLTERWQLANDPSDYFYSSASFYDGLLQFYIFKKLS